MATRSTPTRFLRGPSNSAAGLLLGKLGKRPGSETVGLEMDGLVRGMKVRSSVKKLCDGCKVCL